MFNRKEITKITMKRILFAFIIIAFATALRIWPLYVLENKVVWITYYPAVMAAALYAGLYGGLISTAMTLVIILFFYRIISEHAFINNGADWLSVGVFVFTCAAISFITENMRQSSKRAIESQKKAQLANEAKSAFLANMSHELRTPLSAILGYSRLMQRDQTLSGESMHYLDIINRSGEHLLSLINDILEITKIESRKETIHNESFNLIEMIDDITHMFKLKIEAKKLVFNVIGLSDIPNFIIGDVLKLRVVLINLLGNAVKFTDTGRITLIFAVTSLDAETYRIHFEVQDTGCGIEDTEKNKLFQVFSQTESGLNSKSGTGLGLAISQEYVQQMGGLIEMESHIGIGTRFYFDLKVKSINNYETTRAEDNRSVHIKSSDTAPAILVVDDIAENRDLLITILRDAGFRVFGRLTVKKQ